jgi:hypothetical protein
MLGIGNGVTYWDCKRQEAFELSANMVLYLLMMMVAFLPSQPGAGLSMPGHA